MDDARIGLIFRSLRVARGWRQSDLSAAARVSRAAVWRIEHGHLDRVSLAALRRVAAALEVRVALTARWRGGELDRLIDAGHAALVGAVIEQLGAAHGWLAAPEVSFSIFGERGSIDVLAWHPGRRVLLVIEAKTTITDLQALLAGVDRKRRLAVQVAAERGWTDATAVAAWVVVADERTSRRRLADHRSLPRAALPNDGRTVRGWLRDPVGPLAALSFVAYPPASSARARVTGRSRVRRRVGRAVA